MRNLIFILLILGGSLLAAQEQYNGFNESNQEEEGFLSAERKQDKIFTESEQEEVGTSQFGPGTDTPGGDLEDAEPVPIDNYCAWLSIFAVALIIYYTVQRKKTFVE